MNENKWKRYLKDLNNYSGSDSPHIKHIEEFFRKHDKIGELLDVGCGNAAISKLCKGVYHGIDHPEDIHELPYDDKSFDVVFCNHVLEHTLSPIIVLSEMRRVLKDNGTIIIGVPLCPNFLAEEHINVLTHKGWEQMFKYIDLGLEEFENKEHSGHYLLVKRKTEW